MFIILIILVNLIWIISFLEDKFLRNRLVELLQGTRTREEFKDNLEEKR
jgi:Na+-transporting methylmalonyl-CoA/oxaloacetate decarboxylase gamma subunit